MEGPANLQPGVLEVEPDGASDSGLCACCGRVSRTVWGFVYADGFPTAAYFVHWTPGHIRDSGAAFDLIVGTWGEGTDAGQRQAVSLEYRLLDNGPGFMVVDADQRPVASSTLAGKALKRSEVVGTPFARTVFAIADAVLLRDSRIAELRG